MNGTRQERRSSDTGSQRSCRVCARAIAYAPPCRFIWFEITAAGRRYTVHFVGFTFPLSKHIGLASHSHHPRLRLRHTFTMSTVSLFRLSKGPFSLHTTTELTRADVNSCRKKQFVSTGSWFVEVPPFSQFETFLFSSSTKSFINWTFELVCAEILVMKRSRKDCLKMKELVVSRDACAANVENFFVPERRAPHYGAEIMRAGRPLIGLKFKIQPSDWSRGQVPHSGNKGK